MTNADLTFAVALFGWAPLVLVFSWRLRRLEHESARWQSTVRDLDLAVSRLSGTVGQIEATERTNARDICRIGDTHGDRIQALEDARRA